MAANAMELIVARILEGTAPSPAKAAAARGALPIARTDLVRLFIYLLKDDDEEIRKDAAASLSNLDDDTLAEVFGSEDCAPEVFTFFSRSAVSSRSRSQSKPAMRRRLFLCPSIVCFPARIPDASGLQMVVPKPTVR